MTRYRADPDTRVEPVAAPNDPGASVDAGRAMVLLNRYSIDLTRIATQSLGRDQAANREVQVLLVIARSPASTPSSIASDLGVSRSMVSRILRRYVEEGLVELRPDPADGRSSRARLTAKARRRVRAFESAVADYFSSVQEQSREVIALAGGNVTADAGPTDDPLDMLDRLSRAGSAYVADIAPIVKRFGLTQSVDRFALCEVVLAGQDRPRALADAVHLSSGGTTDLLDRLEVLRLVTRRRPEAGDDGRAVVIVPTARGVQAVAEIVEAFTRHATPIARILAETLPTDASRVRGSRLVTAG
jgi:DNA-binding MarR family transcriptional regulator